MTYATVQVHSSLGEKVHMLMQHRKEQSKANIGYICGSPRNLNNLYL